MVKKIKIRKAKRNMSSATENLPPDIEAINRSIVKGLDAGFETAIKSIPKILERYSIHDVATSLFVSSLWLPNISSPIKHQLLASIFLSMKPQDFSTQDTIRSYDDFRRLMQALYPLLPTFWMLEDYVPEPDWGQVKFYHEEKNYKIFYGNELSVVYDDLIMFQMVYVLFDEVFRGLCCRSPSAELQCCLQMQDDITVGISHQPATEKLKSLRRGHIEIPSKSFWADAAAFYSGYRPSQTCPPDFLKNYSAQLGAWPQKYLQAELFQVMASTGKTIPFYFIEHDGKYLPLLPRRYSAILLDSWPSILGKYHSQIGRVDMPMAMKIGGQLYKYIKARIKSPFLYPLVSAVTSSGRPHETIFHAAFTSKDRLILVYLTDPLHSEKETVKELEKATPKLHQAMELLRAQPLTVALNLDQENAVFQDNPNESILKPSLIIVVPNVSLENTHLSLPRALPGKIVFMDSFLGIIDELDNVDMFSAFLEYLEEYGMKIQGPMLSLLDKFGSFKSSLGVLIEGAAGYDMISIDPHWGSRLRYETLSKFWKIYPERHFFDHPRSWNVTQETESRIRLESRGYLGAAIYCRFTSTHIFLNAPFREMSYEQGTMANLLMECLEDTLSRNNKIIEKHSFFQYHNQLQVLFFPSSLVRGNDQFRHLSHLDPHDKYWRTDYGFPDHGRYGIRLVFNDEVLTTVFAATKDRSLEIGLCLAVLEQINNIVFDQNLELIREELEKQKTGKPRFTIQLQERPASFPDFINPAEPSLGHFKRVRKRIAELAKECKLSAGYYTLEKAKNKLNILREALVTEINTEINKFDFTAAIPFLLERIDALIEQYERTTGTIRKSLEHDVDYDREKRLAKRHDEFITFHKDYRYLIEKFVQLAPKGQTHLDKDRFQYFIAYVDWLMVFYSASDSLHYGIHAAGMKITEDFTVEVDYDRNLADMEKEFSEEEAKIKLGLIGNPDDRVESPRPTSEFLAELDSAFNKDFGFTFQNMISVLQILSYWPVVSSDTSVRPCYSATDKEISECVHSEINEIPLNEVTLILDFLTLKNNEVIRLTDGQICSDVPVWEYNKRGVRYNLRPLIRVRDKYVWGPHSARRSGLIWLGSLSYGLLPADLKSPAIKNAISSEKKLIEDALEDKAFEIVRRFTQYAKANVWLHKIDKLASHPQDLGDYDVLSFHPDKNILLYIECKDIVPPHCLKDAKTLREKIFGEPGKNRGHFTQIDKRRDYLAQHQADIMKALDWPVNSRNMPKIVSIYLTQITYWWTRFSPIPVNASFVRVDMLSNIIEKL